MRLDPGVTTGTVWRFLQLKDDIVSVDLTDYPVPPVEKILGILVWIVSQKQEF